MRLSTTSTLFGFFILAAGLQCEQSTAIGSDLAERTCEGKLSRYFKPGLFTRARWVPDGNIFIALNRVENKTQSGPLSLGSTSYQVKVEKQAASDSDESCTLRINTRISRGNSAWFNGELPPWGIFHYPRMLRLDFDGAGKISGGLYMDGDGKKGTRYWEFTCD